MYTAKVLTQNTKTGKYTPVEFQNEDPSILIEVLWYELDFQVGIEAHLPDTKLIYSTLSDEHGNLIPTKDWEALYQTHRHLHKDTSP